MSTSAPTLEAYQNEYKTFELTVRDEDDVVVDITGATVYFTVRKAIGSTVALITKTSALASEIDLVDPVNGRADIKLVSSDTTALEPKTYVYDVWVKLVSGALHLVVGPGNFRVLEAVTQTFP